MSQEALALFGDLISNNLKPTKKLEKNFFIKHYNSTLDFPLFKQSTK